MTLPKGHTELSQDTRAIVAIYYEGDGGGFEVGDGRTTSIEAYDECGEMSMTPWLAVFQDFTIICRVPARLVSIYYAI